MNQMIIFQLKKKYLQKQTLLKMAMVFIVTGLLVFIDILIPMFISKDTISIALDNSTLEYQQYFESNERICFESSTTNNNYVLVYDNDWILKSNNEVSMELKEELTNMINKAISVKEGRYIEAIQIEVNNTRKDDYSIHLILLTIIYFACLSKTSILVQGLVEEKLNGTINMYLCALSGWKHLLGKILIGWGSFCIDILYCSLCFIAWGSIRLLVDSGKNLQKMFVENVSLEGTNTIIQIDELLIFVLLLLVGIVTIQNLIMIFVAKIKSVDEIGNNLIPIHLILMGNYYLCFYLFDSGLLDTRIIHIVSYLPIINTVLLPMRVLRENVGILEIVLFLGSSLLWLFIFVTKGQKSYKYRLLNIKKATSL